MEKIEATRFPSITLLNRLDGLLDRLEQAEQQEQGTPSRLAGRHVR
jgi:hypothetical protein